MANYLIVVPRGNTELLELLSVAFQGHAGFSVVIDRRGTDSEPAQSPSNVEAERRGGRMSLGPDDIVVAERADRPVSGEPSRSFRRIPVRRRRTRRPQRAQGPRGLGTGAATAC